MALSKKEREKIIEEETLRYETRHALHLKACAEKKPVWPWVLGGAAAVWLLYSWIFCGTFFCSSWGEDCKHGHLGAKKGCMHHEMWEAPAEKAK